ncbi:MAG: DUF1269 domain-containing protein, partial [Chloroflexota bacterium]
ENSGDISLDDSVVIVKGQDGKIRIENELDRGTMVGAVGGSLLGLMITSIFFPIAGLVVGAIGGAAVGKSLGQHVDKKFVKEVTESMPPGSSAIFLLVRSANPEAAIAAFEPFNGKIFHTSLAPEAEESLRQALK